MNLISIIGDHDADIKQSSIINIYKKYKDDIDKVYLLYTNDRVNKKNELIKYNSIADTLIYELKCQTEKIKFFEGSDISDLEKLFTALKNALDEKIPNMKKDEYLINISSGTDVAVVCWLLLSKSGFIPNSKLIQAIPLPGSVQVKEVFLEFPEFPTISQINALIEENESLKNQLGIVDGSKIIGISPKINKLRDSINLCAKYDVPVFIYGETGTGKELIAKDIHDKSLRKNGNFVPVNCGAIARDLIESELFGHKKGAFTGAISDREGYFKKANGGTIFLDEVADLPLDAQVKLLRVLNDGTFKPVGSDDEKTTDARIISATNKNLQNLVNDGKFREDLLYRLCVYNIQTPSLKESVDDIKLQIKRLITEKNAQYKKNKIITPAAEQKIIDLPLRGNVRELDNIIERAFINSDKSDIDDIHIQGLELEENKATTMKLTFEDKVKLYELELINKSLTVNNLNAEKAAEELDIKPNTLRKKIRTYDESLVKNYKSIMEWLQNNNKTQQQ